MYLRKLIKQYDHNKKARLIGPLCEDIARGRMAEQAMRDLRLVVDSDFSESEARELGDEIIRRRGGGRDPYSAAELALY